MRAWETEKSWIVCLDRAGCDRITETNINLDRYSGFVQKSSERDPHTFVVCVLFDAFRFYRLRIKAQSIIVDMIGRDFLEDANEPFRGIFAFRQKIGVPRRAITLLCPEFEEQSAFQDEYVPVLGLTESK